MTAFFEDTGAVVMFVLGSVLLAIGVTMVFMPLRWWRLFRKVLRMSPELRAEIKAVLVAWTARYGR
jgi:hypothetical protein